MANLIIDLTAAAMLLDGNGAAKSVTETAAMIAGFGANGIIVRPGSGAGRLGYGDITALKTALACHLSIEGSPDSSFIRLVRDIHPQQVILTADEDPASAGWDTKHNLGYLSEVCQIFNADGIGTAIMVEPDVEMVRYASETGCKSIALICRQYAEAFAHDREAATEPYLYAEAEAVKNGLDIMLCHGLDSVNIGWILREMPSVSGAAVGKALVRDAFFYGLKTAMETYLNEINGI